MISIIKKIFISASAGIICQGAIANDIKYPNKPITVIVPFSAGTATDQLTRLFAKEMSEGLKNPVVVLNKPGVAGVIGTVEVSRAAPDGYTLLLGTNSTHGVSSAVQKKLPYDPVKDFSAISILADTKYVMVIPSEIPANNIHELISLIKKEPEKYSYASAGNGTTGSIAGALFSLRTKIPLQHVPYEGNQSQAVIDLLAGRTSMMFTTLGLTESHIKSGKLRPLAVLSTERTPLLPDVMTMQEQGIPEFDLGAWFYLLAPSGTPKEIIEKLNKEVLRVANIDEVKNKMMKIGTDPKPSSSAEASNHIKNGVDTWKKIYNEVKDIN